MQTYLKSRPIGSQLLLFLGITAGCFLIFSTIGVILASQLAGLSLFEVRDVDNWDTSSPKYMTFIRAMLVVQFIGLFILPVIIFSRVVHPQPARFLGLQKPDNELYFLLGVVIMIVAIPMVEYLGALNQKINFPDGIEGWMKKSEEQAQKQILYMLKDRSVTNLLLNLFFIAGFAGVGEELFFRGVLQRLFIKGFKNAWAGIILAAILFSAFHFQFYGFFPRFLLGILLGAIYWYSGSLWPAIAAHFFYDAFILIMAYFNPAMLQQEQPSLINPASLAATGIASAVATAVLMWIMYKRSTVTYQSVYAIDEPKPTEKEFTF